MKKIFKSLLRRVYVGIAIKVLEELREKYRAYVMLGNGDRVRNMKRTGEIERVIILLEKEVIDEKVKSLK